MSLNNDRIVRAAPTITASGQLAVRVDLGNPRQRVGISAGRARHLAGQLVLAARLIEAVEGVVAGGRGTPHPIGSS